MTLNVVKFGGSSFRKLEDYHFVSDLIVRRLHARPHRLVVVVSAMYGHTDRLLATARSLSPNLSGEASDSLLTTGEFFSASLLKIALEARGIRASALNAHRLGILSDSSFTQAAIRSIDTTALRSDLQDVDVAVVTGAQAIDERGRITMLGRNSSDLTAVALAGALGLDECEIYSDVPGVYSADPNVFPNARLLPRVSLPQIIAMSRSGAKVIHFGAAEHAHRLGVQILCRATSQPDRIGTIIAPDSHPAPAVVLNEKACFFEFDSSTGLELAEDRLSAWGVASVRVDLDGSPVLAVTQGVLSVSEFLHRLGIPFRPLANRGLITVIGESGELERTIADGSVVRSLASRFHDQICGQPMEPPALRVAAGGGAPPVVASILAMSAASLDGSPESDLLSWITTRDH